MVTRSISWRWRLSCGVLAACVLGAAPAQARLEWATGPSVYDKPGERDWSIGVTPYLWLAGADVSISTPATGTITSSQSFSSLASSVDFGLAGMVDLRWRRWHVISDNVWVKLGDDAPPPGPLFTNAHVDLSTAFGTAGVAYELPLAWSTAVDVYMTGRWWHFKTELELEGIGPTQSGSRTSVWGDAVGGVRLRHRIDDHWAVSAGSDVGGGGSDLTWSAYGALRYRINRNVGLGIGYRAMSVDYSSGDVSFEQTQNGLLFGMELGL